MQHQNPTLVDVDGNAIATRSLLQTITASNSATVDFQSFVQTRFKRYIVEIDQIVPNTDAVDLWVRFSSDAGSGSVWRTGASDYRWIAEGRLDSNTSITATNDIADSKIQCNHAHSSYRFGSSGNEDSDLGLEITNLGSLFTHPRLKWEGAGFFAIGTGQMLRGVGQYSGATSGLPASGIDGIRFMFSAGLVQSGEFRLYGQE